MSLAVIRVQILLLHYHIKVTVIRVNPSKETT